MGLEMAQLIVFCPTGRKKQCKKFKERILFGKSHLTFVTNLKDDFY